MKAASRPVQVWINRAIEGLAVGDARRFTAEGFMRLCVERIDERQVSVCHYGEQNGDAMRDPDVVFWRGSDDLWYPISYRNDYLGEDRAYVEFEAGVPVRIHARMQRDCATFCATWVRNIGEQGYTVEPVSP